MLYHAYKVLNDCSVGSPVCGKDAVDGFNANDKRFLSMLMAAVNIPSTATGDSQKIMHTSISNTEISLAREFQKHVPEPTRAYEFIDHEKYRKQAIKHK